MRVGTPGRVVELAQHDFIAFNCLSTWLEGQVEWHEMLAQLLDAQILRARDLVDVAASCDQRVRDLVCRYYEGLSDFRRLTVPGSVRPSDYQGVIEVICAAAEQFAELSAIVQNVKEVQVGIPVESGP